MLSQFLTIALGTLIVLNILGAVYLLIIRLRKPEALQPLKKPSQPKRIPKSQLQQVLNSFSIKPEKTPEYILTSKSQTEQQQKDPNPKESSMADFNPKKPSQYPNVSPQKNNIPSPRASFSDAGASIPKAIPAPLKPASEISQPILLVDNIDSDRKQATTCLARAGYKISDFKSGENAYEAAMFNDYKLILTDLWLVGMDGFEFIKNLRQSGVVAPIAVVTSYITKEMVRELFKLRVCKIFIKPVPSEKLISFVQNQIQ